MQIKSVKSPGGIEAWLVSDTSVPLIALRFAFAGGNAQDPAGKEGVANFISAMLDEGAGDLNSSAFQERLEEIAMRMSFEDGKDAFYGSVEMLSVNREKSLELLKLALNKPRFDADAVERIRKQLLASLAYAARDPDRVASRDWYKMAFPNHPYGRPASGTAESLASITRDDLEAYRKRVFARSNLKVVAVGDIDEATYSAGLPPRMASRQSRRQSFRRRASRSLSRCLFRNQSPCLALAPWPARIPISFRDSF
jgi:zinc protease